MKRLLLMVSAFWLVPDLVRAQPELGIALKSGPNAAILTEDNRVNRYGFTGGLATYLQWPLASRFSLTGQLELLYTTRGAEATFEGEFLADSRRRYFDVTAIARPAARLGPASVYLVLGGGLNLLLSGNLEYASGMRVDITEFLRQYDVAWLVGAGGALHLPRQKLGPLHLGTVFLEARHERGLIATDADDHDGKNRTTSLMLGVSFALGGGAGGSVPAARTSSGDSPVPAAAAAPAGAR